MARPVPATPASRWLRALILFTAAIVVLVEAVNLRSADDAGFALVVRTGWALLRVLGFLVLARAVRLGRAAARPFGLILVVTTIFAVARLAVPSTGALVPRPVVVAGFAVLALACAAIVWLLFGSRAIDAHLAARPMRRHVPAWALTVRVAALAYSALLLVPLLVALGGVASDERRAPLPLAVALLGTWVLLLLTAGFVAPIASFFVIVGKRWARWLVGTLSVVVLVAQPLLCYALLGFDGLLRDGLPMVIIALLGLYALHRSRGQPTWVRAGAAPRPEYGSAQGVVPPG